MEGHSGIRALGLFMLDRTLKTVTRLPPNPVDPDYGFNGNFCERLTDYYSTFYSGLL
jgi:hypothetical protein